ncbi:hypothetical protein EVAR_47620_1 [Eumeta japonica]|uniref:Uncharacterized protein n=1 Tax=Eumeta variegata TaxID=151549 RepID=A0A4C1ZR86_EUMVA|nr:hypothetical protein EVAR_47620_1 [Eumeta japonica]
MKPREMLKLKMSRKQIRLFHVFPKAELSTFRKSFYIPKTPTMTQQRTRRRLGAAACRRGNPDKGRSDPRTRQECHVITSSAARGGAYRARSATDRGLPQRAPQCWAPIQ